MNARNPLTLALALALGAVALVPAFAAAADLLDAERSLAPARRLDLRVALAAAPRDGPSLDFDLLGDAPPPAAPAADRSLRTRRRMLDLHQGIGLGLLGLQLGSTVTGHLNYADKFGTANTGRYKATHQVLVYSNLVAFAVVGGIGLFAPTEKNAPPRPYGRTTIHKIGMALATAGMISQGLLGIQTARREGYLDKQDYGRVHLAVGYATLAAMGVAVGALVL